MKEDAQIGFGTAKEIKQKIDQRFNEFCALCLQFGLDPPPKKDWSAAGFLKWANMFDQDALGLSESMEWAKKKKIIQNFLEDIQKILEEALNV